MNRPDAVQSAGLRNWLVWTAGFLAFPLAGVAGTLVVGRVDGPVPALLGGTVAGLVLGAGQVLASRRRLNPRTWIPATAVGMGVGLLVGAANSGYGTSLGDLMLMGLVTGIALGVAQTLAMPPQAHRKWTWAAAMLVLWPLGWAVTTVSGIEVGQQFTIFGVSGALTFTALSGLLLHRLLPDRAAGPLLTGTAVKAGV